MVLQNVCQNPVFPEGQTAECDCWGEVTPQYPVSQMAIPTPPETG